MDTLVVGGAGKPRDTADPHPVGADIVEVDRAEVGDDIGVQVVRPADLVEQLRSDGADADQTTGAGMLGDDARAVVVDLGEWEAGRCGEVGDLIEEAVVASARLRAAFDDVPGDNSARQAHPSRPVAQFHHHAAGPTTRDASVTRGQITTSAPASSAAAMPHPPRYALAETGVGGERFAGVEVRQLRP